MLIETIKLILKIIIKINLNNFLINLSPSSLNPSTISNEKCHVEPGEILEFFLNFF